MIEQLPRVVRSRGAYRQIGPKLPSLFREVGLALRLSHVQPVYLDGEAKVSARRPLA